MYSFVAKEIDYASYFQTVSTTFPPMGFGEGAEAFSDSLFSDQLIEVQAEYHRKSLELLQSVLPQIKAHQGEFQTDTHSSPTDSAPAFGEFNWYKLQRQH